jgi:hypothetical protein
VADRLRPPKPRHRALTAPPASPTRRTEQAHTDQHQHRNQIGTPHARDAQTPEVNLGNVPTDASFPALGSFPSHQLGNSPIEFFEPSIGLFYRRICQKYDL